MNSRLILNLILLISVGILGAVAFFEPGKTKPVSKPLVQLDEKALTSITLTNRETMTFEKINGHWSLTTPFKAPANEIRIRQLIEIAKSNSEASYPLDPANLVPFELDTPRATLTLGTAHFLFGGTDPINMRRYVQVGETLHLVSDDFFHHLTALATDYVDKKLLPDGAKIREIQIPGLKATLGNDGKWVREPAAATGNGMSDLLTIWNSARAIEVRREVKPSTGETIRIGLSEGPAIEFVIVQRQPDLVLARHDLGLLYEMTTETSSQLLNQPKPVKPEGKEGKTDNEDLGPDGEGESEGEGLVGEDTEGDERVE